MNASHLLNFFGILEKREINPECYFSSETVNFFLPFALLLLRTLRPLTVDILSRKPCLFFLFLTDG